MPFTVRRSLARKPPTNTTSILLTLGVATWASLVACSVRPQTGFILAIDSQLPLERVSIRVYGSDGAKVFCQTYTIAEEIARLMRGASISV